jgi:hypothetical protein
MSEVARRSDSHPVEAKREPSRKHRRSKGRLVSAALSAHLRELRSVLGGQAEIVWLPEMSEREQSAWRTRVRDRENAGKVDPVVRELRAIREGQR